MLRRVFAIAIATIGLIAISTSASAANWTLDDCDAFGCKGSTLELDVQQIGSTDHYNVTLTIDTTNYFGDKAGFNQVGFLAIRNWDSVMLTSNPDGTLADFSDPVSAPTNSNSLCDNTKSTNKKKVCSSGFAETTGGEQTWSFEVWGGTLMDVQDWHIGAQYADPGLVASISSGTGETIAVRSQGDIISTGENAVPEPTAALVFAMGFGIVGSAVRRRR